ncbi:MAG: aspartate 1-decarboxylase [Chloroflexota bacterium]|nr:aspartate 1-decarboxylase [Chloroflexota bacterium]MDE2958529.1 aspartate 1-decarboxylase [Chloroflexota bacterium]
MREMLKSKIHRCWVTGANLDYVGSILIDRDLMDQTDIITFEKVAVLNVNNGQRWETYALPGERGSGDIVINGAGAHLCEEGDCLIVLAYEFTDEPSEPKMVLVDENNKFLEWIEGSMYAEPEPVALF